MGKEKNKNMNTQAENAENELKEKNVCEENNPNPQQDVKNEESKETEALKLQVEEKTQKCEEYMAMIQRMAAEFDNYKKRTAREKEALYTETVGDVIAALLPVVDNLERAVMAAGGEDDAAERDEQSIKSGVQMILRQMKDIMKSLGVEEIKSLGESFDPQLHNAVMHIEDESLGENVVVEEFQKGYIIKERVVRHSMVKVAN